MGKPKKVAKRSPHGDIEKKVPNYVETISKKTPYSDKNLGGIPGGVGGERLLLTPSCGHPCIKIINIF